MPKIEISTSQNVKIIYELPSVFLRILAFIIDFTLITIVFILFFVFLSIWTKSFESGVLETPFFWIFIGFLFSLYHLLFEVFWNGQSPAKRLLKLRVIKLNGSEPDLKDFMIRWLFRSIEIGGSLGSIAVLCCTINSNRQRLGDILANTTVIKTTPDRNYSLQEIINNHKLKDYTVSYTQAAQLDESYLVLVKETLVRYKRRPSPANIKAISQLAKHIAKMLDEPSKIKQPSVFLSTVLKDYVYLTR